MEIRQRRWICLFCPGLPSQCVRLMVGLTAQGYDLPHHEGGKTSPHSSPNPFATRNFWALYSDFLVRICSKVEEIPCGTGFTEIKVSFISYFIVVFICQTFFSVELRAATPGQIVELTSLSGGELGFRVNHNAIDHILFLFHLGISWSSGKPRWKFHCGTHFVHSSSPTTTE